MKKNSISMIIEGLSENRSVFEGNSYSELVDKIGSLGKKNVIKYVDPGFSRAIANKFGDSLREFGDNFNIITNLWFDYNNRTGDGLLYTIVEIYFGDLKIRLNKNDKKNREKFKGIFKELPVEVEWSPDPLFGRDAFDKWPSGMSIQFLIIGNRRVLGKVCSYLGYKIKYPESKAYYKSKLNTQSSGHDTYSLSDTDNGSEWKKDEPRKSKGLYGA